jgi:hypothetical protein
LVRIVLPPLEAALRSIDSQHQAVLVAGGDLARPERPARPVGVAQHHLSVIVEPAARAERGEVGRKLHEFEAGHVIGEVVRVGADVAATSE